MKDKWLVVLEVETYDGDPRAWDWRHYIGDECKVITSEFKGRVLTDERQAD